MPISTSNAATVSGASWTSPTNAQGAPNGANATITWNLPRSATLTLSSFSLSPALPSGALITNISVTVRANGNGTDVIELTPTLSTQRNTRTSGAVGGGGLADYQISGSPDQWNLADLTSANVGTLTFALAFAEPSAFSFVSAVDAITLNIDWTTPEGGFLSRSRGRTRSR